MLGRRSLSVLAMCMVVSSSGPTTSCRSPGSRPYPLLPDRPPSDKYSVWVNDVASFVYQTRAAGRIAGSPDTASWTNATLTGGTTTVRVTRSSATPIRSVLIRPLDKGIQPTFDGNTVSFTVTEPSQLSVEFDDTLTDKCFIFINAPEIDAPLASDESVLYFGPGVYDVGKDAPLPARKNTIYLAEGAYLLGSFKIDMSARTDNLRITGRGVISGERIPHADLDSMFRIYDSRGGSHSSKSIVIDGVTIVDSFSFNIDLANIANTPANPNVIENVKEIGWAYNTDGFHSTGYLEAHDLFIFNSDDALDVGQFTQGAEITDCVLWQNRSGSSLLFGWVGTGVTGNTVVNNIDIIHFTEDELWDNNFVFMANHGESGHIQNISITDVRIEAFGGRNNRFLGLRIAKSPWSNPDSPFGSISDVSFKDIRIDEPTSANLISGRDSTHAIYNIDFEHLVIAGSAVASLASADIAVNPFVYNVTFH